MSSKVSLIRKGLTLVEMLFTIAVICILIAMLFPYLTGYSHGPSRRTTCLNNMKNVALACLNYEASNSRFPAVVGSYEESFLVRILPQLDNKTMYDDFRSSTNQAHEIDNLAMIELEVLRCSSAASSDFEASTKGSFTSHYAGCAGFTKPLSTTGQSPDDVSAEAALPLVYTMGPGDLGLNGMFSPKLNDDGTLNIGTKNGVDTSKVNDGLSNTMAIIETSRGDITAGAKTFTNARVRWSWGTDPANSNQVNWGRSIDRTINSFDDAKGVANPLHGICISSNHNGGANVANGDGSVRYVSDDTDLDVLRAAAGIDDGVDVDLNY